jgi:hypothetical protein
MGDTTTFKGEFRIRRRVAPQIEAFLASIESDARSIPVLADWLEDQQDERAAGVRSCRTFAEVSHFIHALTAQQADYLRPSRHR